MGRASAIQFLIVDDSRHMRRLYRDVIEAMGFTVKAEAQDGNSALVAMAKYDPDIIVTDLAMYPMDGIALTQHIRKGNGIPNPFVPILMISGHAEMMQVRRAVDAGISEFIAKPFKVSELYQRIQRVIETPRAFVRGGEYLGPDRRRGQVLGGPRRRNSDPSQERSTLL
jgi:two-component system chemotaxis response regulator CheY